jgi:hypothetical protein
VAIAVLQLLDVLFGELRGPFAVIRLVAQQLAYLLLG